MSVKQNSQFDSRYAIVEFSIWKKKKIIIKIIWEISVKSAGHSF